MCSVIITPHINAVSSLEELRRLREWLRRRFGHYAKGEESGNDGGDTEFHGGEFFPGSFGRESQQ